MPKWDLTQVRKSGATLENQLIWSIQAKDKKSHIHLSKWKKINKTKHPFMIKTLSKLRIRGNFLNLIKNMYKKPTANIILNVRNPKLSQYDQEQSKDAFSHQSFPASFR